MLAPRTFIDPTPKPRPKKRKWLRQVTPARSKQLREYSLNRKLFLEANPICCVWLANNGWVQTRRDSLILYFAKGYVPLPHSAADLAVEYMAPRSTEIHHRRKRNGAQLNNEADWLAVCRKSHEWLHAHPAEARAKGWLV